MSAPYPVDDHLTEALDGLNISPIYSPRKPSKGRMLQQLHIDTSNSYDSTLGRPSLETEQTQTTPACHEPAVRTNYSYPYFTSPTSPSVPSFGFDLSNRQIINVPKNNQRKPYILTPGSGTHASPASPSPPSSPSSAMGFSSSPLQIKRISSQYTKSLSSRQPLDRRSFSGPPNLEYASESKEAATAAAVVQQEMDTIQTLKRLSIGASLTTDPDLPELDYGPNLYNSTQQNSNTVCTSTSTSPTKNRSRSSSTSYTSIPEFSLPESSNDTSSTTLGSPSQASPSTSSSSDSGPLDSPSMSSLPIDASQLLWVPANVHPEIAPQEWKTFVQHKVAEIKSNYKSDGSFDSLQIEDMVDSTVDEELRTSQSMTLDCSSSNESNSESTRSNRKSWVNRRNSRLSRQIDVNDLENYVDGSEILQKRKSNASINSEPTISSLSTTLRTLTDLESLAMDPFDLTRSIIGGYDSDDTYSDSDPLNSDTAISSMDSPLLASPSNSLRRSTNTRYRKASARRGVRKSLDPGDSVDSDSTLEEAYVSSVPAIYFSTTTTPLVSPANHSVSEYDNPVEILVVPDEKRIAENSTLEPLEKPTEKPEPLEPLVRLASAGEKNNAMPNPTLNQFASNTYSNNLKAQSKPFVNSSVLSSVVERKTGAKAKNSTLMSPSLMVESTDLLSSIPIVDNEQYEGSQTSSYEPKKQVNDSNNPSAVTKKGLKSTWGRLFSSNSDITKFNESASGSQHIVDTSKSSSTGSNPSTSSSKPTRVGSIASPNSQNTDSELSSSVSFDNSSEPSSNSIVSKKSIDSIKMKGNNLIINPVVNVSKKKEGIRSFFSSKRKDKPQREPSDSGFFENNSDSSERDLNDRDNSNSVSFSSQFDGNDEKTDGGHPSAHSVAKARLTGQRSSSRSRSRSPNPKALQGSNSHSNQESEPRRLQGNSNNYYNEGIVNSSSEVSPLLIPPNCSRAMVMYYHRFPLHIERAIYRLSHLKLANIRRPLLQQVLLSNFMYAYLDLINHGYQQQYAYSQETTSQQLIPDEQQQPLKQQVSAAAVGLHQRSPQVEPKIKPLNQSKSLQLPNSPDRSQSYVQSSQQLQPLQPSRQPQSSLKKRPQRQHRQTAQNQQDQKNQHQHQNQHQNQQRRQHQQNRHQQNHTQQYHHQQYQQSQYQYQQRHQRQNQHHNCNEANSEQEVLYQSQGNNHVDPQYMHDASQFAFDNITPITMGEQDALWTQPVYDHYITEDNGNDLSTDHQLVYNAEGSVIQSYIEDGHQQYASQYDSLSQDNNYEVFDEQDYVDSIKNQSYSTSNQVIPLHDYYAPG